MHNENEDPQQQQQQKQQQDLAESSIIQATTTVVNMATTTTGEGHHRNEYQQQQEASNLRTRGKELHDAGNYDSAAQTFAQAADIWKNILNVTSSIAFKSSHKGQDSDVEPEEEYATCKLHEALCHLKDGRYSEAIDACQIVLEIDPPVSSALRARAHFRRAKARLATSTSTTKTTTDTTSDTTLQQQQQHQLAMEDARAAAFLGDRKAVALYGKLLLRDQQQQQQQQHQHEQTISPENGSQIYAPSSFSLFESLMNPSTNAASMEQNQPSSNIPAFPSSLLGNLFSSSNNNNNNNNGGGWMQSMLQSVSTALHDENTQQTICGYVNALSSSQLQTWAALAGLPPLADSHAQWIVQTIQQKLGTPSQLQSVIRIIERIVYVVRLIRAIGRVLQQYRHVLLWLAILTFAKSAILRPLPTSPKRRIKPSASIPPPPPPPSNSNRQGIPPSVVDGGPFVLGRHQHLDRRLAVP
jgi:tetratricopeptide (TPR) repeat protein